MGVAFLRKDGFVSLEPDGSASEALIETKPIRFRGTRLYINADVSNSTLRVELADLDGKPLPGFEKEISDPIASDSIRHIVRWAGNNSVSALNEKAVIVRFYLTGSAKLYSYRFGPADPHPQP